MHNGAQRKMPASLAGRKKELIAQGAAFRAGIINSTKGVHASLRPELLGKSVVSHLLAVAFAAFKKGGAPDIAGLNLQALMPLVVAGVSALSKKPLLKPVMRGALILGVTGAVAALMVKRARSRINAPG
jgi:hypothetical protein